MPYEQMDLQQVSAYLRMDARKIHKLSCRGQIPCRKAGGSFIYFKADVDHWVETQIPEMDKHRLADIEKGVRSHHGYEHDPEMVCAMMPEGGVVVPLLAKTKQATLRAMVDLADVAGMVYDRDELLQAVVAREEMCTTALAPSVAMPHPRHPLPYDISPTFVVVGLTYSGIPFGAEDGSLTRLFFLICCKDEQTHLHVLARLCRMLHSQKTINDLLVCESAADLRAELLRLERAVLHA